MTGGGGEMYRGDDRGGGGNALVWNECVDLWHDISVHLIWPRRLSDEY